jgi:hypothetical protein
VKSIFDEAIWLLALLLAAIENGETISDREIADVRKLMERLKQEATNYARHRD